MIHARIVVIAIALAAGVRPLRADPVERPRGAVFAGRVVDERGVPVPKVTVEVYEAPYGGFVNGPDWRAIVPASEWWAAAPEIRPIGSTSSGADGRWRIEGLDPTTRCRARVKPGGGKTSDEVVAYPSTIYDSVDLIHRSDEPLTLRATDAAGAPIAAEILVRGGTDSSTEVSSPTQVLRTGADGRARIPGLPRGFVDIEVRVPGRAVVRTFAKVPSPEEIVVRVGDPSGAAAGGTVTDAAGAPVAGAHVVVATRPSTSVVAPGSGDSLLLATTDAKGAWAVARLPLGVFLGLSVAAEGFVPALGIDARRRVASKDTLSFTTVLGRACSAEGRIVGSDGKAVAGARVSIQGRATHTDGSGGWRLDSLEAGVEEIRVTAAGQYLENSPADTSWNPGGGVWVNLKAGAVANAPEIALRRGVRVEGVVVDEGGKPVAGASVFAWSTSAGIGWLEHRREAAVTTSAADGTYVLDGLVPGDGWGFSVRSVGMASDPMAEALLRETGRVVRADFTLRRLWRVAGRTVDLAGKPAPAVEIELIGPGRRVVTSDAEGRFEAADLPAGAYRIVPTYVERPHRDKPGISVSVGPGEPAADVVFSLDPPRAIAGVVVDEKGVPAAGVPVRLKAVEPWRFQDRWLGEEAWWSWGTLSDAAGRFRIDNLWPGSYWIRPSGDAKSVEAGAEDVRLVWWRDAAPEIDGPEDSMRGLNRWDIEGDAVPITGRVLGPDGREVPSAQVTITARSGNGSHGYGATVVAGRWRSTIRSGSDSVDVEVEGARDASGGPLDFGPAKTTGLKVDVGFVELRMPIGRSIAGRVLDADGKPVAGAAVFANRADEEHPFTGSSGTTATDASGAFRFVGLPEAEFRLSSAPAPRATLAQQVVSAGATDVELRYSKMQWIEGRVIDEASRPIVGFGIATEGARTKTSIDGTFRIGPVEGDVVLKGPETWTHSFRAVKLPEYGPVESAPIAAGSIDVELRSPQVYVVSGVVIAGEGVEARPDVELRLDPEPADPQRTSVTGRQSFADTSFHLTAPPGKWRLTATSKAWNGRDHKVHTTSVVVTSPTTDLKITLQDPVGLRGSLVGEDAAGFLVSFVARDETGPLVAGMASGEDGSFKWSTEEEGPFLLFASRIGDDRFALADDLRSGAPDLRLALAAGLRIEGKLEGFGASFDRRQASVWAQSARGLLVHAVLTDDGKFSLRGLPPAERWTVEVRAFDGTTLRSGAALDVPSGTTDLVVRPSP